MLGNETEKRERIRAQRKNCYVCGILLVSGEEFKKGNEETDIRWFCEPHSKKKPVNDRKQVVLIKR